MALIFKAASLSVALLASSSHLEGETPLGGCDYSARDVVISPVGNLKAAVVDVQCGATTRDASWVVIARSDSDFSYEKDRVASFNGAVSKIEWSDSSIVVTLGQADPVKVEKLPPGGSVFFMRER